MVVRRCSNCGYKTKIKTHYTDHFKRKTPCTKQYFCQETNCDFTCDNQAGLDLHMNHIHSNVVINNINSNNVINNTIVLPFSKTDYSKINDFISLMLNEKGYVDVVKFFELTHFNNALPQNHNIDIVDGRTKQISILEENGIKKFLPLGLQGILELSLMADRNVENDTNMHEISTSLGEIYKETYNPRKKNYLIENLDPAVKEEIQLDLRRTLHGVYEASKKLENLTDLV